MAAMLLMVAGVKSWSVDNDQDHKYSGSSKSVIHDVSQNDDSNTADGDQARVSSLSLDAVITPAISFDFFQYFYFVPQPAWSFIQEETVFEFAFREPAYLFSCFNRIFGRYIVTNAP
ncbi:hypothetical protein E0F88_22470 [Dyadobacter psychrotolerans]|uniref:Uncharacterized protein n=2 Tax=Dyadobacter psychrotolerans TaxID=2541721 RepID=A0A4R5DKP2_9BACT|nr:hypothetical protein E0F88_22470 [Dyadobacter psychrotolerans]